MSLSIRSSAPIPHLAALGALGLFYHLFLILVLRLRDRLRIVIAALAGVRPYALPLAGGLLRHL